MSHIHGADGTHVRTSVSAGDDGGARGGSDGGLSSHHHHGQSHGGSNSRDGDDVMMSRSKYPGSPTDPEELARMVFPEGVDAVKQLAVAKHQKKKAANDAQLLMNRIALLQKEEERARRKIDQTKERAQAIIAIREENERRVQEWIENAAKEKEEAEALRSQNMEFGEMNRIQRAKEIEKLASHRKMAVRESRMMKAKLRNEVIKMKEDEVVAKQEKHRELREKELEARRKREEQKREHDRKVKEYYEAKARREVEEVRRAEQLVRELEQREREWIERLKSTQHTQERTFVELENALKNDSPERRPELFEREVGPGKWSRAGTGPGGRPVVKNPETFLEAFELGAGSSKLPPSPSALGGAGAKGSGSSKQASGSSKSVKSSKGGSELKKRKSLPGVRKP